MDYDIKIYEISSDNLSRFSLGTIGAKPLYAIGVNPSTADDINPDPTIKRIMGFAKNAGFDSFVMLNVYPQRTPYPDNIHLKINKSIHKRNIQVIHSIISKNKNSTILACWGNEILKRPFLIECLHEIYEKINKHSINWLKIGELTIKNNPRHASRTGYDWGLTTFDIEKYFKNKNHFNF